jgi:hypothetical protein
MRFTLCGYVERDHFLYADEYVFYTEHNVDQFHGKKLKAYIESILETFGKWETIMFSSVHEDLFNIFGHYIANNRINADDVEVILFTDDHERIECSYDNDGFLVGHPLGFFHWS